MTLQRANDSSLVKIAATNASGQYSFLNIQPGKFFIGLSFVSYRSKTSAPFEVNGSGDITVPEMVLEKTSTSLQDVTINSKKPMVEVRADKMILNVEGTINATGNDEHDKLGKAPVV